MRILRFTLPLKKRKRDTLVKKYDLIKPARCLIEEKQRYLHMKSEDSESYVAYLRFPMWSVNWISHPVSFLLSGAAV